MAMYGSTRYAPTSYRHAKCAACGKEFACPMGTRYKKIRGNTEKYFCSYTCFRTVDKPEEERAKKSFERECRRNDEYLRNAELRRQKVYVSKKLKTAQEKEAFYAQEKQKYKKGTHMYENARKCLSLWRRRRIEAMKAFDEINRAN